jgi:hypothetical protein
VGRGGVNDENRVDINQTLAATRARNGGKKGGGKVRVEVEVKIFRSWSGIRAGLTEPNFRAIRSQVRRKWGIHGE